MEEARVNDVVNNELKAARGGGEQNLTVALRIRPISEDEILQGATIIAHKVEDDLCVLMDPTDDPDDVLRANRSREKQFVFDHIFDGSASQQEVYQATTSSLIPNVISGYNATVFAYGATGAGKTHTMLGSDDDPGIMVRALNDLFLEMEKTSQDMAYKATMSYLEIYNEMIRDLLNPGSGILDLREDARGGVQVAGLSEVTARSTREIMEMLLKGNRERTSEPTAANLTSSRSHAVLQVTVKQRNRLRNVMQEVRTGKLFLIDLAGSERAANTHNRGKRMVEGAHINRSLLALGNCINALSDKSGSRYINYRDSKLTRLLKDALGGNCKTVMIAHISPASLHFEESRNTLVYADRAKHIKTKVRRNVTDVAYHIAQYTNIIAELREEINQLRTQLADPSRPSRGVANIQAVQSEVLEATRHESRAEMNMLKEQLLTCFKDQMELRKSLMELNNASMEISLETNRNQLVVSEWELSRARSKREHEVQDGEPGDDEKSDTLVPADPPEDVIVARNELKVLHDEKRKTEKLRITVNKELEAARQKTKKFAEMIPIRISNDGQREILNLLTRVHILEIESLETQSSVLYRDYQIKKKDMVITRYRQHRTLCDQIIRRQRDIIDEHKIPVPNDLQSLYELYKLEAQDRVLNGEESGHSTPDIKLQISSHSDGDMGQGEKFFTPSAKAKHIRKSQDGLWPKDDSSSDVTLPDAAGDPREYRHRGQSPLPNEDRSVIATNTRNIAALAARKRTKAQYDLVNAERQGGRPLFRPIDDHGALTPSRLAHHNQRYDGIYGLGDNVPSDDNLSSITADRSSMYHGDLPPLLALEDRHRGRVRRISQNDPDQRRRLRNQTYDRNVQIAQTNAKLAGNPKVNGRSKPRQSNPYAPIKTDGKPVFTRSRRHRQRLSNPEGDENSRTQEGKLSDGTRAASERGRKKKAASKSKNNGKAQSDSSAVSTPQGSQRKEKKALPSIANYRKGDITVTGFGLPKN